MFTYEKRLQYPVNIKKRDLKMAKVMYAQYGGADSELAAALRYFNQRYTMPDDRGRALLTDIATEELAHIEMIQTMIYQLTAGATIEELKAAGLDGFYSLHGRDLYPQNPAGVPFNAVVIGSVGDHIANLYEDLAAEEKARAVYEHLIDLTTDLDVIEPLLFLRQREIVHFTRFKNLLDYYKSNKI